MGTALREQLVHDSEALLGVEPDEGNSLVGKSVENGLQAVDA